MGRSKREPKDEPHTANYPPLARWLTDHDARCLWGAGGIPRPWSADVHMPLDRRVSAWLVGSSVVLVVCHADRRGWEVYTAANTNAIDETLRDAEERCSLRPADAEREDVDTSDPAWSAAFGAAFAQLCIVRGEGVLLGPTDLRRISHSASDIADHAVHEVVEERRIRAFDERSDDELSERLVDEALRDMSEHEDGQPPGGEL